jgi:hypothetical protein
VPGTPSGAPHTLGYPQGGEFIFPSFLPIEESRKSVVRVGSVRSFTDIFLFSGIPVFDFGLFRPFGPDTLRFPVFLALRF